MSVFGRRKKSDEAPEETPAEQTAEAEAPAEAPTEPTRPQGPWDEADVPDDGLNRVDLGGLRVPVPPDTEVRVDVGQDGQVIAATLVRDGSAMQVNAFAAPRSEGIWDEVRSEIAAALVESGGRAAEVAGPFGTELHAMVPAEVPGQGRGLAPARFVGVDGPRWFVRALLTGPGAVQPEAAGPLLSAFQQIVVVRGTEAMMVRDPLPLRLPPQVAEAAAQQAQPTPPAPPQPSPGIAETR